jgi:CRISPR system Cascade subunit CasE
VAAPRASLGVLHRLELVGDGRRVVLLVQSREQPDSARWVPDVLDPLAGGDAASTTSLAPVLASLVEGQTLRFRLRANPTRKIDTKTREDGKRRNGRRVPVRGDDLRTAWLTRQLAAHGMNVLEGFRQRPDGTQRGRVGKSTRTHEAHFFDGLVEIVDAALARAAVEQGIGPAKAYGFGLLSIAAAR